MNMGIVVEVAGRKMQEDFEPVLERQIHYFVNGASGIQHIGQRDITWIRFSKGAVDKGFGLKNIGDILYARLHAEFGAIVDKVQVTIYTDPEQFEKWLAKAREAYQNRNVRLADMVDAVGGGVLQLHALPELRSQPRLRHLPRAAGALRRLQLARLQGLQPDQPDRPQPADRQGHLHRPGLGRVGREPTTSPTRTRTRRSRTSPCTRSCRTP